MKNPLHIFRKEKMVISFLVLPCFLLLITACSVSYNFKDVSIPPNIKTIKIGFIENKARIVNPQLSSQLTDKIQQKIVNQTKLTRTNNDDAHLQITGYISDYSLSTTGVNAQQAATNRLTVSVHIKLKNTVDNKDNEFDVSRNFDFAATLSLDQAQQQLQEEMVRNLTDEIFNRLFSNW
jgi:hypothetical protein